MIEFRLETWPRPNTWPSSCSMTRPQEIPSPNPLGTGVCRDTSVRASALRSSIPVTMTPSTTCPGPQQATTTSSRPWLPRRDQLTTMGAHRSP